jgi:hypothetical protein
MCSIIGSFTKEKIIELCELNKYRGEHSNSISYYIPKEHYFFSISRALGPIDYDRINIPKGAYCVVHMQAPTTENKTMDCVHPAAAGSQIMWHNGILKPETIDRLREKHTGKLLPTAVKNWDTFLLLLDVKKEGYPKDIDGSFSCLYADESRKKLWLFRNEISPLFWDTDMNVSSTKFENSVKVPPNQMWEVDFKKMTLLPGLKFRTVLNPYVMTGN